MTNDPRAHRQVRRAKAVMFERFGDVCHICGHPGATVADHLLTNKDRPDLVAEPGNMRPAHGVENQRGPGGIPFDARCQTCLKEGKKGTCNGTRGAKPLAAYVPVVKLDGSDRGWRPGKVYVPPIVL
jgi:hypothetical protein